MKYRSFFIFLFILSSQQVLSQSKFDVIIYGGTPSGITAAIQSAKMGLTVALIEPTNHMGGIMTNGLSGSDIDSQTGLKNSGAVGGLALEFYQRIAKKYDKIEEFEDLIKNNRKDHSFWVYEPHVAEETFTQWIGEYDRIKVFKGSPIKEGKDGIAQKGTSITWIQLENGEKLRGKVFIDGSYEGDLMAAAGISYFIGREANSKYNETLNGNVGETLFSNSDFKIKIDPYNIPQDPTSGLIYTVQDQKIGVTGEQDHHIQAYCFRLCMTQDSTNQIPFQKPENYNRDWYEIYIRYLEGGGKLRTPFSGIPNGKTDFNAYQELDHNLYGMNDDYPDGSYARRRVLLRKARDFTQGLFYFYANDTAVARLAPEFQKTWASWGLARDEYLDNEGWPHQLYIRDARRMVSNYVITEHHALGPHQIEVEDPIGVAYWPLDVHAVRRIVKDGYVFNEGAYFDLKDAWEPFSVSYRALVPKASESTNFLNPTTLSASHIAYGAVRLEWTYMILGQAVGVAAALAIKDHVSVQGVSYDRLRQVLLENNAVLRVSSRPRD